MSFEDWKKENATAVAEPEGFAAWQQENAGLTEKPALSPSDADVKARLSDAPRKIVEVQKKSGLGLTDVVDIHDKLADARHPWSEMLRAASTPFSGAVFTPEEAASATADVAQALSEIPRNTAIGFGLDLPATGLEALEWAGAWFNEPAGEFAGIGKGEPTPEGYEEFHQEAPVVAWARRGAEWLRLKEKAKQDQQVAVTLSHSPVTYMARRVIQQGIPSTTVAVGLSVATGNPAAGYAAFFAMSGGPEFKEQRAAGASFLKANGLAVLTGAAEVGGEMLVLPKFVKGVTKGMPVAAMFTLMAENGTQEGFTSAAQYWLHQFGILTTQGMSVADAAQKATDGMGQAILDGAIVGIGTAGVIDLASMPANYRAAFETTASEIEETEAQNEAAETEAQAPPGVVQPEAVAPTADLARGGEEAAEGQKQPWEMTKKEWEANQPLGVPVYYHQTSRGAASKIEQQGFSLDYPIARRGDTDLPDAVFLKDTISDIGLGASEIEDRVQIESQVDLRNANVKTFRTRDDLRRYLKRDTTYDNLAMEADLVDREGAKAIEEAADRYLFAKPRDQDVTPEERQKYDDVVSRVEKESIEAASKARKRATEILKSNRIDAVVVLEDTGFMGRKTYTLAILDPKTVKPFPHKRIVKDAIAAGKPVPPEVLADYPDLQQQPPVPASESALIAPGRTNQETVGIAGAGESIAGAKEGREAWEGAAVEDENRWYGTKVTVAPELKGEEEFSGTVTRVLNGGKVIEIKPDGYDSTFRYDSTRVHVIDLMDSGPKAAPQATEAKAPKLPEDLYKNPYKLAAKLKAAGVGPQEAYSRYVQAWGLRGTPLDLDAKEFHEIYKRANISDYPDLQAQAKSATIPPMTEKGAGAVPESPSPKAPGETSSAVDQWAKKIKVSGPMNVSPQNPQGTGFFLTIWEPTPNEQKALESIGWTYYPGSPRGRTGYAMAKGYIATPRGGIPKNKGKISIHVPLGGIESAKQQAIEVIQSSFSPSPRTPGAVPPTPATAKEVGGKKERKSKQGLSADVQAEVDSLRQQVAALERSKQNKLGGWVSKQAQRDIDAEITPLRQRINELTASPETLETILERYNREPKPKPEDAGYVSVLTGKSVTQEHREFAEAVVEQARKEGKPIPAEVVKDYPDLSPAPAEIVPPAAPGATVELATPKPFTPDPTTEGPAAGEAAFVGVAGRPGGKVAAPWLTHERVRSPDSAIEGFFGRTDKPPRAETIKGIWQKLKEGLRERFVFASQLPDTTEAALARDMIRTMPEEIRAAADKAVDDVQHIVTGDGTVQALDMAGLELLRRKVFIQDLVAEAELDRSVAGDFQLEQLQAENERLDSLMGQVPSVQAAYEARQQLWAKVGQDLFERGVISEEAKNNQAYVRHFVLLYAEMTPRRATKPKKLSEPYRAYKKQRKGYTGDISTDYLAVEITALADIYRDNAIEDLANQIGENYNKRADYTAEAKEKNFVALVGGQVNANRIYDLRRLIAESYAGEDAQDSGERLARKIWIEELTELDPTYPYRIRIAIQMGKLQKALGLDEEAEQWGLDEDSLSFAEMGRIIREEPQSQAAMYARGAFKAIHEREQMIKDSLGDQYLTPERLAETDGYAEWWYKRPNLMYLANTLTEAQMAMLLEHSAEEAGEVLQIPRDMMRQALVMGGKRKGILIPGWLAKQLDNLPVNRRSNLVVRSFATPAVQFLKRWYLRINPLRYNARNALGDLERLNASGQTGALRKLPEAARLLAERTGDIYETMRQYGVVGSSLWHEMNDPRTMQQFERFQRVTDQKEFASAVSSIFKAPLQLLSKAGQVEQDLTQFREDLLRASVFLHNLDRIKRGERYRHWAGRLADVQQIALSSPERAAAKLSRETMVDYGEFTPFENDVLRNGLIPFYSYLKKNLTFWPRAFKNAAVEGETWNTTASFARAALVNIPSWALRVMSIYGLAWLWNHWDDDAEKKESGLEFWLRSQPHLNVGGYTLWGDTALNDFSDWFGMEELSGVAWRYEAGFINGKQAAMEAAKAIAEGPVNKVYQAIQPLLKQTQVAITGTETYPNVFEPRIVAEGASAESLRKAILGLMGADAKKFYETATGKRKFEDTLYAYFAGWFVRPTDPDAMVKSIQRTEPYVTLKQKSPTTGRAQGGAKADREQEWQELQIRKKALR